MPYMSMPHAMDVNEEFDSLHKAKPGFVDVYTFYSRVFSKSL